MSAFGVVLVAVDAYPDPPGPLPSSESAQRFGDLLGGEHGGTVLASVVASSELEVVDAIRTWSGDEGQPLSSIVYLVGHGRGDGLDHDFLVPDKGGTAAFRTVRLAQDLQRDWLRRQADPTSWTLLVLDCCDSAVGVDNLVAELASKSVKKPRRLGLWPVAPGGAARTGAFVDAFEQAIESFDVNDEVIALDEVFRRMRPALGDLQPEGFLPDEAALARPRTGAPVVAPLDVLGELQRAIADQPPEIRSHFLTKAQGGETGALAWHFSGRQLELDELRSWMVDGSGMKVVTGEAGSGKSALLGHMVVVADPQLVSLYDRSGLAPGLASAVRPPGRAFDAVVHLTGKTLEKTIDEIAGQLEVTAPSEPSVFEGGMRARIDSFVSGVRAGNRTGATVLVDALDESQDPNAIASFLREAGDGPLRVLVGTRRSLSESADRPSDPSRRELLDALGVDDADVLVVERDRAAVYSYVKQRLAREDSPYADRPELLSGIARLIADAGEPFLFARLATAELLARPVFEDPRDPALAELLRHGHRGIFAAALGRLAAVDPAVVAMVRALAYARGRGMPRNDGIWVDAAVAVAGVEGPTDTWEKAAMSLAGPYISLDAEAGQSTYRLAHQTFVEHFTADPGFGAGHRRIAAVLTGRNRDRSWVAANHYAVRYVAEHLVADADRTPPDADGLRALVTDPGWLTRAIRTLGVDRTIETIAAARHAAPSGGDDADTVDVVERALRRSRIALGRDPAQLPSQLHARLKDVFRPELSELGSAAADVAGEPWLRMVEGRLDWRSDLETTNTMVGKVRGLGFGEIDGRPIVAVAIDHRVVLWDPRTGAPDEAGTIDLVDHRATAVAVAEIGGRPVVVTSSAYDSLVEVWDARTSRRLASAPVGLGHTVAAGRIADRLVIAGIDGSGGATLLDARTMEPIETPVALGDRDVRGFGLHEGRLVALCLGPGSAHGSPTITITAVDAATGVELSTSMDLDSPSGGLDVVTGGDFGSTFVIVAGIGRTVYWLTGDYGYAHPRPEGIRLRAVAVGSVAGRPVVASTPDYDGTALIELQQAERQAVPGGRTWYAPRTLVNLVKSSPAFVRTPLPPALNDGDATRMVDHYSVERPEEWPHTATTSGELDRRAVLVTGSLEGAVWVWDNGGPVPRIMAGPFVTVSAHVLEFGWRSYGMKPGVPSATSIALGRHSSLGPIVAVACDGRVRLYAVPDGEPIESPTDRATVIDVVDLGRLGGRDVLVTGSKGGVVGVWGVSPPERIAVLTLDEAVTDLRIVAGELLRVRTRSGTDFAIDLIDPEV